MWSRFLAAPVTLGPTPGAREAWHRGRERYAVWVLRVDAPAVLARHAAMVDLLAPHGATPFPDPHVTVFVAGFPAAVAIHDDDVTQASLAEQVEALAAAALPSPRLSVSGLNAFLSCAVLEVLDPHGDLEAIRALLAGALDEVRFAPYLPHLTVGPFGDTRPTGPIAETIRPLRVLPPLSVRPGAIELVTFDAWAAGPLTTVARVPLGGERGRG